MDIDNAETPTTGFFTITPDIAEEWLDRNTKNRPQREGQIERYADQMRTGNWMTSPDAIAFDTRGRLINGQHRLEAIVRSGVPQNKQLVVSGLDPEARKISDVGAKRTASDMLHVEGYRHPQELGAVLKLLVLHADEELEKCNKYEVVEKHRILKAAELFAPRIYESIELAHENKQFLSGRMPRSLLVFAHFLYCGTYGETATEFTRKILTGEKIGVRDWGRDSRGKEYPSPAKLLRDKLIERRVRSSNRKKWLAYLIQAMNWYCTEEPHHRLRYRADDCFPKPNVEKPTDIGLANSLQ